MLSILSSLQNEEEIQNSQQVPLEEPAAPGSFQAMVEGNHGTDQFEWPIEEGWQQERENTWYAEANQDSYVKTETYYDGEDYTYSSQEHHWTETDAPGEETETPASGAAMAAAESFADPDPAEEESFIEIGDIVPVARYYQLARRVDKNGKPVGQMWKEDPVYV